MYAGMRNHKTRRKSRTRLRRRKQGGSDVDGTEEPAPEIIALDTARTALPRARLALRLRNSPHDVLEHERLDRRRAHGLAARGARVVRLRDVREDLLHLPADRLLHLCGQVPLLQELAALLQRGVLRGPVGVGRHVLCERGVEPVLEAVEAEGVSAGQAGRRGE